MKITDALLGEHGAIYPLLDFIESGEGDSAVKAALLRSALLSHAELEDRLLKPALLPYLPQPTGAAPTDHEAIAAKLQGVLDACIEADARTLLLDAVRDIRKHFRKEESVIFPLAEEELSEAEQRKLATEWSRRRGLRVS